MKAEAEDITVIEDIGLRHDGIPVFRPSAFYFRRALWEAGTVQEAREIGMTIIEEMEHLKAWVREQGYEPGKRHVLRCELDEKNAADRPRP